MTPARLTALGLTATIIATILIYWPGVHGGFVLDDYANIVNNSALHIHDLTPNSLLSAAFSSNSGPLDRPLSMLSFALNEYFFGPAPYSMKITNIFIHALNGLLLYAVAALILTAYRRRFRPDLSRPLVLGTALAITAAWMLLPINLTSVLYVVQRMTSLSGTFVLAGVALYLWGRLRMLNGKAGFWMLWIAMIFGGGLGVLAKEIGALLPVYTLAIEWTLFAFARSKGRRDGRMYLFYLFVLVLPGILGLIWLWPGVQANFLHSSRPFTLGERLLTEPRIVLLYIVWSLAPNLGTLTLYHDDFSFSTGLLSPPTTLLAILGIIALVALALWQRKRRPLLSLGILWFLGGQLMTATIFNLELIFEHRNYLPDFGLLLAVFSLALLERPVERLKLARRTSVIGLIVLYALILGLRVQQWANPLRYAVMTASLHPNSPRATYDLGRLYASLALLQKDDNTKLRKLADEALVKAAAVPDSSILPDQGLLLMNARLHQAIDPAWWARMTHKLGARPASAQDLQALRALVNCELTEECRFPNSRMQAAFDAALKRNPRNAVLTALYSNWVLNILKQPFKARELMLECLDYAPRTAQYWINIIKLDIFLGRFADAERELQHLASLNRFGSLNKTLKGLRQRLQNTQRRYSQLIAPSAIKGNAQ
jgi:protein O-mannosyl-transferase